MKSIVKFWNKMSLVQQIIIGLIIGIILALLFPEQLSFIPFFGDLFVGALKAVAPVLVLFLVTSAIAQHKAGQKTNMKRIIVLYLLGTFLAGTVAVIASFIFKLELALPDASSSDVAPPGGIVEVMRNLLMSVVDNPINAIATANYIGILAWAIAMGIVLRHAAASTREVLLDASKSVEFIVRLVIRFAPIGIFGLVSSTLATTGLSAMAGYVRLLAVLLGTMAFVALIVNPFLVWLCIRSNPYPYTFLTLRESGVSAFFTRSSAANIPVNLEICRRLNLPESTYSISIPVGATVNMGGASVTITVLTLSAAYSLGVPLDVPTAVFLSFVAAICAAGASGVPGGSLMLIPLSCGLFGIDADTAMQVVAVGFIIGVLQDSCETALNSSSDALFTIAACKRAERLQQQKS